MRLRDIINTRKKIPGISGLKLRKLNLVCYAEDFWLGLKKIHSFSQQGVYILRIDLEDWKEEKHWAEYHFSMEGPSKDYTIQVSHFSGDLPDVMANSTSMRFLTKDRNHENHRNSNCTRNYTGKQFYKLLRTKASW